MRRMGRHRRCPAACAGALAFAIGCTEPPAVPAVAPRPAPTCGPGHPDLCVAACKAGEDDACDAAATMFLAHGRDRAAILYRDLCEAGRHRYCPSWALALVTGDGTARDVARGRDLFATYCKDDAVACGEYGSLFLGGVGVAKDTGMAHLLLGLACDHGEAAACRDLALVLDAGCAQRHGPSCNERGVMAAQGRGAEPDAAAAFSFFERSCAIDDANGCSNLAKAYAGGHGVTADPTRAAEESARACRLGSQPDCEAAITDGSLGR